MSNHNDEDVSVIGSFERETRLLHKMDQDEVVAPAGYKVERSNSSSHKIIRSVLLLLLPQG